MRQRLSEVLGIMTEVKRTLANLIYFERVAECKDAPSNIRRDNCGRAQEAGDSSASVSCRFKSCRAQKFEFRLDKCSEYVMV